MFFMNKQEQSIKRSCSTCAPLACEEDGPRGRSGNRSEKLAIFGPERARRGAELKVGQLRKV